MRPVDPGEILDLTAYEKARADFVQRMIDYKTARRVSLGENLTFIFENRETVIFQIQELTRAERTVDPEQIALECKVFNELVPGTDELSATLMIEITDPEMIRPALDRLVGIDEPRNSQCTQYQESDKIHANDFADKKYQRDGEDAQDHCDFEGHSVNLLIGRRVSIVVEHVYTRPEAEKRSALSP